jgi:hypothetical protein
MHHDRAVETIMSDRHIAILKQGNIVWNEWAKDSKTQKIRAASI